MSGWFSRLTDQDIEEMKAAGLSPTERLVWIMIHHHEHPDGGMARPGLSRLSSMSGYNERTVRTAIDSLQAKGWIKVKKEVGRASMYRTPDLGSRVGHIPPRIQDPPTLDLGSTHPGSRIQGGAYPTQDPGSTHPGSRIHPPWILDPPNRSIKRSIKRGGHCDCIYEEIQQAEPAGVKKEHTPQAPSRSDPPPPPQPPDGRRPSPSAAMGPALLQDSRPVAYEADQLQEVAQFHAETWGLDVPELPPSGDHRRRILQVLEHPTLKSRWREVILGHHALASPDGSGRVRGLRGAFPESRHGGHRQSHKVDWTQVQEFIQEAQRRGLAPRKERPQDPNRVHVLGRDFTREGAETLARRWADGVLAEEDDWMDQEAALQAVIEARPDWSWPQKALEKLTVGSPRRSES